LRKVYEYSHLGGSEILQIHYPEITREIDEVIAEIRDLGKTKISHEKTMLGQLLYSPRELNSKFKQGFRSLGYRELRDRRNCYPFEVI